VSQWPDPTPEPGEPPRWLGWGALGVVIAGILIWNPGGDGANGWRMPEFALPEISLPEFELPDFESRQSTETPASSSISVTEDGVLLPGAPNDASGAPVVQNVPFETCVQMIEDSPAFGEAIRVEDTAERRVVRFKTLHYNMTLTCSRADGTLSIERSP